MNPLVWFITVACKRHNIAPHSPTNTVNWRLSRGDIINLLKLTLFYTIFLQAKTFEQTLPIGIEVKNVQYILASLLPYPGVVKLKQTEEKIPKGMNFILKISLHDNLGNEFSHNLEDVNSLRTELSHKDIVDAQIGSNLTVSVSIFY